jgi:predicted Zn-dependent protease
MIVHSRAADLIGLRLANQACFDPRAAEGLWQRMSATEEMPGVDMSFLSTHPSSKNRTVQVRKWADEVSWEDQSPSPQAQNTCRARELTLREHIADYPRPTSGLWAVAPPSAAIPTGVPLSMVAILRPV